MVYKCSGCKTLHCENDTCELKVPDDSMIPKGCHYNYNNVPLTNTWSEIDE